MDHRGIVLNDHVGALVCLGRAYAKMRILIFPSSSLHSLSTPRPISCETA